MNETITFKKYEKFIWVVFFIFLFFSSSHPDILETSNHSYLFLESIFTGNVFDFYNFVESRPLDLYYINYANYNILTYIIFGVWQLPVYIFAKIFSISINGAILVYYTKIISVAFYLGCGYMIMKISQKLNLSKNLSYISALFFLFNPIALFSPFVMGQYDTFCLFFLLFSIYYYLEDNIKMFTILIGVSAVFKFFSFLAFIPLLLLKEKKLVSLIKYSILSFWLYIPTTLLYLGKTGNAQTFTKLMFDRILTPSFETTFEPVSIFLFLYALICVFAYFYTKKESLSYISIYIVMAVYILLFYGIYWHPQWVILVIPFIVLTTFMQKNKLVYLYIDIILCFGFFMTCFREFPNQIGYGILSNGIFAVNFSPATDFKSLSELFLSRIPYFNDIIPLMLTSGLFANLIFKFPVKNSSISDSISDTQHYDSYSYKTVLYTIFILGFISFWLIPSALEYLNAYGVI